MFGFRFPRYFRSLKREMPARILNWFCKLVQDYLISFLFSYFFIYGLCCALPQIASRVDSKSLFGYTAWITLGLNLMFSHGYMIVFGFSTLLIYISVIAVRLLSDPEKTKAVNQYFHWLISLLLPSGLKNPVYEQYTLYVLMILCCLLMVIFTSRATGSGLALLILIPFAIFLDLSNIDTGPLLTTLFVFAVLFYHLRSRYILYLDRRLSQIDAPFYSKYPHIMSLPAIILVLVVVVTAGALSDGRFVSSSSVEDKNSSVSAFFEKAQMDFFQSRKEIDYAADPIGYDNGTDFFNQDNTVTFKVNSYLDTTDYIYLRSHAALQYDKGWKWSKPTPISPTDPVSPFTMGHNELTLARNLLSYRDLHAEEKHGLEFELLRMMRFADLSISYQDIRTNLIIELPMASTYSAFKGSSFLVQDDLNGSGIYSSKLISSGTDYTIRYVSPNKSNTTIDFYRYFGKGFYASLKHDEAQTVYGDRLSAYLIRANSISKKYIDTAGLSPEIIQLGKSLINQSDTTMDQALSIAEYLLSGYTYDKSVYLPARGKDYVSSFLFETHKGNAVHFASSAVLLLRSAGIPARYCEGYLVLAGGDTGEVTVRQKDEHAWAELYLEGLGWIPLEVTPTRGSPSIDLLSPNYHNPETKTSFLASLTRQDLQNGLLWLLDFIVDLMIGVVKLAIGILILMICLSALLRAVFYISGGLFSYRASLFYIQFLLRLAGNPRKKGEGLLMYAQRIDKKMPTRLQLYPSICALYAWVYGGEKVDKKDLYPLKHWNLCFHTRIRFLEMHPIRRLILYFF